MIGSPARKSPAGTGLRDYDLLLNCGPDSNTKSARKLPPFGREVIAAIDAGRSQTVYMFCGPRGWERAQRRRREHGVGSAVVVEQDALAGAYDWRFLRGQAVVLHADAITVHNRPALIELSAALVDAGCRFVSVSDGRSTFAMRGCAP